jgi:hypothetical protein
MSFLYSKQETNHSSLTSAELAQKAQELRDNAEKLDEIAEICSWTLVSASLAFAKLSFVNLVR